MTKLEDKLKELGYKQNGYDLTLYYKLIDSCYILCIHLENKNRNIKRKFVYFHRFEIDLEILEKLSNEMQKDLEVLKMYEEEKI